MAWQYLTPAKLLTKANVLAGPILRQVTADSVTVWFALQKEATVTLFVTTKAGAPLFSGAANTTAVGAHLHIVAVTAQRPPSAPKLVENNIYTYDATFVYAAPPVGPPPPSDLSIAAATKNAPLTYAGFTLPSFCMPASNIHKLRIVHGSCRKAAGDGLDALAIVDTLIDEMKDVPLDRPQQMLLTGDQIYADDVPPSLLMMLTDAATVLMGWDEILFTTPTGGAPASTLPPYSRRAILEPAGFTSEDLDSHLMSLGEYLCMYLFMWSDVLWPTPTESPLTTDVRAVALPFYDARTNPKMTPGMMLGMQYGGPTPAQIKADALQAIEDSIHDDLVRLNKIRPTLPNVRRALANIATYMNFDDHEVTDDWNMTEYTAFHLYATPCGRRIVQNALTAFALCQYWGNAPDQFLASNANLPGTKLLGIMEATHSAMDWENNGIAVGSLLSVPNGAFVEQHLHVEHNPGSFTWNYTIEGLAHQIIVTDTRTWRTYPRVGGEPPDLLPPSQMAAQIVNTPPLNNRQLIVVLSTNMPPVPSIRTATRLHWVSNRFAHMPDIHEAWDLPSVAFDRLVKALSDKVGFSTTQTGKVVLLSGDVHIGFASRLHYKAIKRYEDTSNQHANMVVAQLVASSFKKQTGDTIGLQREGYRYSPKAALRGLIFPHITEYYVGWNIPPSGVVGVGRPIGRWGDSQLQLDLASTVQLDPSGKGPLGLVQPPDHSYQLDYANMTNGGVPKNLLPLPAPPPRNSPNGPTQAELDQETHLAHLASDNLRTHNLDPAVIREIIGVNNMGDLSFPAGSSYTVNHRLRFFDPGGNQLFVDYQIVLDANDPNYPSDPKHQYIQVTP
ncbi:MAG: hypothetical protein ABJE10_00985 [bacterium]